MKEIATERNDSQIPRYHIIGGNELHGEVSPGGSKNAAFPILAASILLSEPIRLNNVPNIEDIIHFIEILNSLGAVTKQIGENTLEIDPRPINITVVPPELGGKIRGSYYFLGALLSRFGEATIPSPGGCKVGERPMDQHFVALSQIGFEFQESGSGASGKKNTDRHSKQLSVVLPFPSRGATINTLLAVSLLDETEISIINYNQSPEAQTLIDFLQRCGASIETSDNLLRIKGTSELKLREFTIIPDKIEVATLLTAGLITKGDVAVRNIRIDHLIPFLNKITQMGFKYQISANEVRVDSKDTSNLMPVDIIPGLKPNDIDADFEPILASLLCTITGDSIIEDEINPRRHERFIPQLNELGASIDQLSPTRAVIHGGTTFHSGNATCNEIRGGAALLLATLSAVGNSTLYNISQIERGYEGLDQKLSELGANIIRVSDNK